MKNTSNIDFRGIRFFHATYRARLARIKRDGLGVNPVKNWEISKPHVTYLSSDPSVAYSYCESAENVSDSVYNSGIVVFEIDPAGLKAASLRRDSNIQDDPESGVINFEYHGIIDTKFMYPMADAETRLKKSLATAGIRVPTYQE